MPTMRRAAVALGMLVLVAACARPDDSVPISGSVSVPASVSVLPSNPITATPPTISAPPSRPSPSAGGSGSAPARTVPPPVDDSTPLPQMQAVGNWSVGWTFAKSGSKDTDVLVQVELQACRHLIGEHVTLSGTTATIAVLASAPPPGICPDLVRNITALVRAPQSLTGYHLAHARLGK